MCAIRFPRNTAILVLSLLTPHGAGFSHHRVERGSAELSQSKNDDDVEVTRDDQLREVTYSTSSGACRLSLTVFESDANRHVIRHRAQCELPLSEQAALMAKVMRSVLRSRSDQERFRTLSWGRLHPDGPADDTMSVRLALAAHRSMGWNSRTGKPKGGDVNGFVRDLARQERIYRELLPVFKELGLRIELASVEKVLVLPAGKLPFFPALQEHGIAAAERVPFDCMAWFSIGPEHQ